MQIRSRISKIKDFGLKQLGTGFKVEAVHAQQKLWELAPPRPPGAETAACLLNEKQNLLSSGSLVTPVKGKKNSRTKCKDDKTFNKG